MQREGDLLKRPVAVAVLAAINWVGAVLLFLAAGGLVLATILEGRSFLVEAEIVASLGALAVFCGYGLLRLQKYGRTLSCVITWIGLLAFPFGTLICILILVYR